MSRRLLMEGILETDGDDAGCVMYPSVAYVVQPVYEGTGDQRRETGKRAYFFTGKPDDDQAKALHESVGAPVQIVESYDALELTEREVGDRKIKLPKGTIYVEGVYQRSDVRNANKRVYPRKIWEKHIADRKSVVNQLLKERKMIGHLEHPKDGRTDLKESALLNVDLTLLEDGSVYGKSELLDTPSGLILQELTTKGVSWGVSSRGNGTVNPEGVVQEDFQLVTFDAVASPSTPGAYPKMNDSNPKKTKTNEAIPASAAGEVDEAELRDFESEWDALKSDPEELDESRLNVRSAQIMNFLGRYYRLSQARVLSEDKADEVKDWLDNMLRDAVLAQIGDLGEAALGRTGGDDDSADLKSVVEHLRSQLETVTDEADAQRDELKEVRNELQEAEEQIEHLTTEAEQLREQLSEAEARADLAESLLADSSERNYVDEVKSRVDSVVEEFPQFELLRALLERADSPEAVDQYVSELVERDGNVARLNETGPTEPKASKSIAPSLLPMGVLVESEKSAVRSQPNHNGATASRGVKVAARAVAVGKK